MNQQLNKLPLSHPPGMKHARNSPCFVSHVLDGAWGQRVGGQGVVEGDGDAAQGARAALHHAADVSLKGQVPPFVFHHLHPVHPLQGNTPKK